MSSTKRKLNQFPKGNVGALKQAYTSSRAHQLANTPPGRLATELALHTGLISNVAGIVCDYVFDSVSFPAIRQLWHNSEAEWKKMKLEYSRV